MLPSLDTHQHYTCCNHLGFRVIREFLVRTVRTTSHSTIVIVSAAGRRGRGEGCDIEGYAADQGHQVVRATNELQPVLDAPGSARQLSWTLYNDFDIISPVSPRLSPLATANDGSATVVPHRAICVAPLESGRVDLAEVLKACMLWRCFAVSQSGF